MTEYNSIFSSTFNSRSPYRDTIVEFFECLEDANIINSANKQKAIEIALEHLKNNSDFIMFVVTVDDVLDIATGEKIDISIPECLAVLDYLQSQLEIDYTLFDRGNLIQHAFKSLGISKN